MKRVGVQIAAVGVVVLLGALAAAQAQKDSQTESDSSWAVSPMPELGDPPAPIADLSGSGSQDESLPPRDESVSTEPPSTAAPFAAASDSGRDGEADQPNGHDPSRHADSQDSGSPNPSDQPGEAVQLVQHTEPASADEQQASRSAPPSLGMTPPAFTEQDAEPSGSESGMDAPALAMDAPETPLGGESGHRSDASSDQAGSDAPSGTGASQPAGMSMPAGFGGSMAMGEPAPSGETTPNEMALPRGRTDASGPAVVRGSSSVPSTQPQASVGGATASEMPELQFGQPPAMAMAAESPRGEPETMGAPDRPVNVLRGAPSELGAPVAASDTATSNASNAPFANRSGDSRQTAGAAGGDFQSFDAQPSDAQPSNAPSFDAREAQPSLAANAVGTGSLAGQTGAQPAGRNSPYAVAPGSEYAAPARRPAASAGTRGSTSPSARLADASLGGSATAGPTPLDQPNSAAPLQSESGDAAETVASPGDRRLEGAQSPSVVIQKRAPGEVQVGKPASFVIQVQNVGAVEALDVQVHDRVPTGMRLVGASPEPIQQGDRLLWQLGALAAGEERTVTMRLVPEQEGELGSVARVSFEAAASVRTISTRPELKIVQRAPEQVLIGQQLEIELEVSNPGTGEATGVILQEDVPQGLEHPKGRELDNLLGNLRPGEVRREVLRLRAVEPGMIRNTVKLVGDDGLTAEHHVEVEVIAPELQVDLKGPSRRFLERQATYEISLANQGTADATNVELAAYLDRGFTFVSTGNQGQYDSARHAVFWSLAELPKSERGSVELTLLPVERGEQAIRLEANGDLNVRAEAEHAVAVDALAELSFQLADAADPIEIGSETTYEIRVRNSGSRDDSNVEVQMHLPAGLELVSSDAQANTDGQGNIFFQPQSELSAGGDVVYQVRVRGVKAGTHVAKATVTSDQSAVPVTKEESTMVYSDR